ncbi:hypothetical protein Tco_1476953 [Tanacetum coccineum]
MHYQNEWKLKQKNDQQHEQEIYTCSSKKQNYLPKGKHSKKENNHKTPTFVNLLKTLWAQNKSAEQKQKLEEMMLELLKDYTRAINLKSQCLDKEKQEVKNIVEQEPKRRTRFTKCLKYFKVIHKKSSISLNNTPQISPIIAITPDLPIKEPEYSLSMGDEHLSTIPEMESDKLIKSSVENLVPIPSESEVTSDNESERDVPVNDASSPIFMTLSNPLFDYNDDFTSSDDKSLSNEDVPMENFKIYSSPLFDDEKIISTKIDPHYFNAESNLIESLFNRNILIDSSLKFDYILEEFSS